MIYLAIPYTGIEETSFKVSTAIAGQLMKRGYNVYAPITHSHEIARVTKLPTDWEYWENIDREYLDACDELWVVCIDGWKQSKGVTAEIAYADSLDMPVKHLIPVSDSSFDGLRFVSAYLDEPLDIFS